MNRFSNLIFNFRNRAENKIHTHLTIEEKKELLTLASSLRPNSVIVEIGSYLGASSVFLAKAVSSQNTKVYCIDTWENQGMSEGPRDTYEEFINNSAKYADVIVPLRGFSSVIATDFNEEIDMIFFDGDHSFDGVFSDIKLWLPKMKQKGIVVFHDYGWAEGVRRVVHKFILPITAMHYKTANMWWGYLKNVSKELFC